MKKIKASRFLFGIAIKMETLDTSPNESFKLYTELRGSFRDELRDPLKRFFNPKVDAIEIFKAYHKIS